MFDLSPEKLLLLGVIALVVLGPNRMPDAARTLGRGLAHLKRLSTNFQAEVHDALGEPGETLTSAIGDLRSYDLRRSVRDAFTSSVGSGAAYGAHDSPAQGAPAGSAAAAPAAPDDPSFN